MIILTNGKSCEQRRKIEELGLENMFKLYISGERILVNLRKKHLLMFREGKYSG